MKRLLPLLALLLSPLMGTAQLGHYQNFCTTGADRSVTSNLLSKNYFITSTPGCQVTVYLAGAVTKVAVYSDAGGTQARPNPFNANGQGYFSFYSSGHVDVKMAPAPVTGQQTNPTSFTFTDINLSASSGSISQATAPTFSPPPGTYNSPQNVSIINSTAGAQSFFTGDGSTPNLLSLAYSTPVGVTSTTTLKALSVASGLLYSPITTALYTITNGPIGPLPLVLPAVFFPANGSTPTHPYNVLATSFPDDTRCFVAPGGGTCVPVSGTVDTTTYPFGLNYLRIDPSMPWQAVDSGAHPETLTTLYVDNIFGDAPYTVANVPIRGTVVEGGLNKCVANGGTDDGHDHHDLIYDVRTKILYEAYQVCTTTGDATGDYHTATYANPAWDATKFNTRALGADSVEAAGREVVPWTLRWSELNSGDVLHAIRFTVPSTRGSTTANSALAFPASHAAGNSSAPFYEGQRFRFDCAKHLANDGTDICSDAYMATLTVQQQRLIRQLKNYGLVVADNSGGSGYYITADTDPAWDNFSWIFLHLRMKDMVPVNTAPITDSNGNVLTQ